jgi:hypothetical protein
MLSGVPASFPVRRLHAGEGDVAVEDAAAELGIVSDGGAEGVQVHAGAGLLQRLAAGDGGGLVEEGGEEAGDGADVGGAALRVRVVNAGRGGGARGAAASGGRASRESRGR